jgi:methionyl-tRNA formyltransferase
MKILFLGPSKENIVEYLIKDGNIVIQFEKKISGCNDLILHDVEYIISYGYRYIIPEEVVRKFKKNIINLHISYLPWNRGSDPNLWSFLEDTPKGVTIHYIDKGLDTGEIIAQKEIFFTDPRETLRTTYNKLCIEIENLFIQKWHLIKNGEIESFHQNGNGSYHKSIDKEKYLYLLENGWDTAVNKLVAKGKVN